MDDFIVDRIPGSVRINPDPRGRKEKRGRDGGKRESGDSISISDEGRRRSERDGGEPDASTR